MKKPKSLTSTTVHPKATNRFILCAMCEHIVARQFAHWQNKVLLTNKKILQIGGGKQDFN